MKSLFFYIAIGEVLLAAAVSASVYVNNGRNPMDDLFNANVEALARNESGKKCFSGGPGSTSCSIEAGIEIIGVGVSYQCSVSCSANYYACCGVGCSCIDA